jgi:DNA replication and repair protein RecF
MGKTNLLDAVYYLSFCKSHINVIDNQIIKYDAEFFMLQGKYLDGDREELVSCAVKHRRKKQFSRNKKEYERLVEHIGFIPLVLVSPADLSLIEYGSDERRRFMDIVISQYDRQYLDNLVVYNSALQNRNALLKTLESIDTTILEVLEEKMCAVAEPIFKSRSQFLENFIPVFKDFYIKIASEQEVVDLAYTSHLQQDDSLQNQFIKTRERDKILGYTTHGTHKDDLQMTLNGFPLKRNGSQGQNKSFLVAMKLAQFVFLKKVSHKIPILLLDDLFDKLDTDRVTKIINLILSDDFGQIFITDTNSIHLNNVLTKSNGHFKFFELIDGEVKENLMG